MKKLLSFLVFMEIFLIGISQPIPQDVIDLVNNCQYIFEGTVIRSDSYWGNPDSAIYTSHTLQIHKILKGNLSCGTIEVITRGGRVGDQRQIISHNLVLYEGLKGAFFCNPTSYDLSPIDYYPETNTDPLQVTFGESGYLRYYNDGINQEVSNNKIALDSIAQVYDAVELLTQLNYIDCEATITNNEVSTLRQLKPEEKTKSINDFPIYSREAYEKQMEMAYEKRKNAVNNVSKTATTLLTYSFDNLEITGISPRYLEFDILLNADDNSSYFDNGLAHVYFDSLIFGTNLVQNNKIVVDRGTILASLTDYQTPALGDFSSTVVAIPLQAQNDPPNRYLLTTNPTQVVHVKVEMLNCKLNGNLSFTNDFLMQLLSYYAQTPNDLTLNTINYPNVDATSTKPLPKCLPQITDFNPKTVKAGVGDIVTITGKFFGQTRGNGSVSFRDADKNLISYVATDPIDSILWSDTQIQVRVASFNINLNNLQGDNHPAGSGKIKVKNSSGDTTSSYLVLPSNLTVEYAISNVYQDFINEKKRIDLVDTYGPNILGNGGYSFYIAPNVYNNAQAYATIKKAMKDWQCLTNIPFIIIDTLPSTWNKTIAVKDQINVIQFGNIGGNILMETSSYPANCPNNGNSISLEIDIIIEPTLWVYDTTGTVGITIGEADFYWGILHELGHAHSLVHVTNKNDIMYGFEQAPPVAASARHIHLAADNNAKNGGNDVINHSQNTPHGNCIPIANIVLLNPCATNSLEHESFNNSLKVYPNPFDDILEIELIEQNEYPLNVELYNLQGQLILKENLLAASTKRKLNLEGVIQGLYILKIYTSKNNYAVKVIKQ